MLDQHRFLDDRPTRPLKMLEIALAICAGSELRNSGHSGRSKSQRRAVAKRAGSNLLRTHFFASISTRRAVTAAWASWPAGISFRGNRPG